MKAYGQIEEALIDGTESLHERVSAGQISDLQLM